MYGGYIVYIHFDRIFVYKHDEGGMTHSICLIEDSSTSFSSDYKKKVYFSETPIAVYAGF